MDCTRSFAAAVPRNQYARADGGEYTGIRHDQDGTPGGQNEVLDELFVDTRFRILIVSLTGDDQVREATLFLQRSICFLING
nr:hypothetical protein [Paraburkholderia hospita]